MSYRLKRYGKRTYRYLEALETEVMKMGTSVTEVIKKEHFDIAVKKVSMGNAITSINTIIRINFLEIFEEINGVEEILRHFNQLNVQLKDKMYIEKAEGIFKCIPMRMEEFYERFDKECMNVPIFKYYDVFQMFQRISCASNEDIVTIKEKLVNRVKRYPKEIEPEMKNIKQLKQLIDDYTKNKEATIKIVMLKEFSKDLEYILDQYKTPLLGGKKEETE